MLPVRPIEQTDPPRSPQETMPTMYDLPSEDPEESGLPDEYHLWQAELLSQTFCPPPYPPEQIFVASDLNLYYDPQNTGWYKRPDWFAVVGVPRLYHGELRLSYIIWQEGVRPRVALELLSPGTQDEDLGKKIPQGRQPGKWQVYEQILGVPYYITFNRYNNDELKVFELAGNQYQEMELRAGRIWLPDLELGLGLWQGKYRGALRQWLRWYDVQGNWISTEAERVQLAEQRSEEDQQQRKLAEQQIVQERQQRELAEQHSEQERQQRELAEQQTVQERQKRELAEQRAEGLAQRLRELGLEP